MMGYLLTLSLIGSVAGLIGGVVFLLKQNWCKRLSSVATPLAAGVLLSLALLDLLPEAVEASGQIAFTVVLATFVIAFLFERFLFSIHHHDHEGHEHSEKQSGGAISVVIVGDTIHNFLDGIAIGAAYLQHPSLALFVALATFLHETPHEIADFGILIANGFSRRKTFLYNFASALATIPGAFIAFYFAGNLEGGVGVLLAIAAGLFLYVSTTDFLPHLVHRDGKMSIKQISYLIAGILIIYVMGLLVPELHA
jgi:zinc and cadmium transporter